MDSTSPPVSRGVCSALPRPTPLRERYQDIEIAHRRDDLVSAKAIKTANQPMLFKMAKTKQAHSR